MFPRSVPLDRNLDILAYVETLLSSMEQPEPASSGFSILLGPRQITAVLVVAITVAGILCSLSYIAGRSASRTTAAPAVVTRQVVSPSPKPLATGPPLARLVPVPSSQPAVSSTWKNAPPAPGAMYLQVMSVPPGVAEVFAEGLHSEGFAALAAPGVNSAVQRVLVGPVDDASAPGVRARLEARGFHPFVQRYTERESAAPAEPPPAADPKTPNH